MPTRALNSAAMQRVRTFIIVLLAAQPWLGGSLCLAWCCTAERVTPPTNEHSHCHATNAAPLKDQADQTTVEAANFPQATSRLFCACVYQPRARSLTARARQSFMAGHIDELLGASSALPHWAMSQESRGVVVPRFQPHSPPRAQRARSLRI